MTTRARRSMRRAQKVDLLRKKSARLGKAPVNPHAPDSEQRLEPSTRIDALDRQLISLLTANGRVSNRELAQHTKVSQVTVANRVRRLIGEGLIRIVAVPDPEKLGYPIEVLISVHVEVKRLYEVATALCRLPEVRYVSITSGAYDLLIAALVRSNAELLDFLAKKLAAIRGIQKFETAHALQILKRNPDWSPFQDVE